MNKNNTKNKSSQGALSFDFENKLEKTRSVTSIVWSALSYTLRLMPIVFVGLLAISLLMTNPTEIAGAYKADPWVLHQVFKTGLIASLPVSFGIWVLRLLMAGRVH